VSKLPWVSRMTFYHMPPLIYELPPGTRIFLAEPTEDDYHVTFRYPLVGTLPGNDVVMEKDIGVRFSMQESGPIGCHADLVEDGVQYVFMRTFGRRPYRTTLDEHPALYRAVYEREEPMYPWYRLGDPVVTKMYEVLKQTPAAANER
jgi:hypothetical protein